MTVEESFNQCASDTIHVAVACFSSEEWNARKAAVDLIYTIAVILPNHVDPERQNLIARLSELRFDKIKHVRDAASVAINALRDQDSPNKALLGESGKRDLRPA